MTTFGVGLGLTHTPTLFKGGWWRAANHLLDGIAPGFFLDVAGQRYARPTLGPELAVNGDGSAGTTGWDAAYQSTLSTVAGAIRVTATGVNPYGRQLIAVVIGKVYAVSVTLIAKSSSGNVSLYLGNTTGIYSAEYSNIGGLVAGTTYTRYVSATTNVLNVALSGSSFSVGDTFDFDNVSVREVQQNAVPATVGDLLTISNAAPGTYIDSAGVLRQAAANTPRIDWTNGVPELLLEGALTNKVTCAKHNPTATTNLSTVGAGSGTISVVDAPDLIAAAGLSAVCTNGKVYRFEVTVPPLYVNIGGTVGNTNPHCLGAYISSNVQGEMRGSSSNNGNAQYFDASAALVYRTNYIASPSLTGMQMLIGGPVGVFYFILPQMVEATVIGSVIPGATTAAVTRTTDLCTLASAAAAVLQGAGAAVAWRGSVPTSGSYWALMGATGGYYIRLDGAGTGIGLDGGGTHATFTSQLPAAVAFCGGWGASGRRASSAGAVAIENTSPVSYSRAALSLGPTSGLVAGQILRVRQLVGWSLADRPSADGVQAQARAA